MNDSNCTTNNETKTLKNGSVKMTSPSIKRRNKHVNYVLWRRPVGTLDLFFRELWYLLRKYGVRFLQYYKTIMLVVLFLVTFTVFASFPGPYQQHILRVYKICLWCTYWCGLGVLSSIGLGTGLHTFLLYLGPHIAAVTLAAYECGTVAFPEPPYPEDIICPENNGTAAILNKVDIWTIMSKVRLEAMCWGAGTALGELPPYFMAKAARLSTTETTDDDDDVIDKDDSDSIDQFSQAKNDLKELEILEKKLQNHEKMTVIEQMKITIEKLVARVGFFGILACASVPNPLFDLAGITCGHFLVPFWTFFGATLIGKAVIKMHIQKMFVIIAFNESLIESALQYLEKVPVLGKKLQEPFKAFLQKQKNHLHQKKIKGEQLVQKANLLSWIFEKLVILMVCYFLVSIVNSLAQTHYRRLQKRSNYRKRRD